MQQWQPWMELDRDWGWYAARVIVWGMILGPAVWVVLALTGVLS